jgi:hypothetical protein
LQETARATIVQAVLIAVVTAAEHTIKHEGAIRAVFDAAHGAAVTRETNVLPLR